MLTYPEIDPVAISLGPVNIHWYGIAYLTAFILAGILARQQIKRGNAVLANSDVEDLIYYGALGTILGGRIGYVFFYNFEYFIKDPLWLFQIWKGGMSFHGGMLGVIIALYWLARKKKILFLNLTDFVAPIVPLGLGFGRIANFIGQELWGRETNHAWGMVFPRDPLALVRHPSQLYEACFEGLILFIILYVLSFKKRATGFLSGCFLVGYSVFRFGVEFLREPDAHIQFDLFDWVTRGQLLCIPMFIVGIFILVKTQRSNR